MLTKTQKENMLQKYADSLSSDEHTKGLLVGFCRDFLDKIKYRDPNRAAVMAYMKYLKDGDYADSSINLKFRTLRRFFLANGLEWPFRSNETPRVRESEVYAPALHPEVVKKFIQAAHSGQLTAEEATFLALSTTYGHRRGELAATRLADVDLASGLLLVKTLKHGRERWHKIPQELVPWIREYPFPGRSEDMVTRIYLSIEEAAGVPHIDGTGFHSIRRTLVTLVGRYCSELEVKKFFRWGASTMMQRYMATQFVGMDDVAREISGEDYDIDDKVFSQHPFIKLWEMKEEL